MDPSDFHKGREGLLIVLSGPSGTGKGTLVKEISQRDKNVKLSVSVTTRKPRKGEVDGESYFFVTKSEFIRMRDNNELIEWVEYCGNDYGTPKNFIFDTIKTGHDIILDIEVEGARNFKNIFPQSVMIFVIPPSMEELRERMLKRGTEDINMIEARLKRSEEEYNYIHNYEYLVVNDRLDDAVQDIINIIKAERLSIKRMKKLPDKTGTGGTL